MQNKLVELAWISRERHGVEYYIRAMHRLCPRARFVLWHFEDGQDMEYILQFLAAYQYKTTSPMLWAEGLHNGMCRYVEVLPIVRTVLESNAGALAFSSDSLEGHGLPKLPRDAQIDARIIVRAFECGDPLDPVLECLAAQYLVSLNLIPLQEMRERAEWMLTQQIKQIREALES